MKSSTFLSAGTATAVLLTYIAELAAATTTPGGIPRKAEMPADSLQKRDFWEVCGYPEGTCTWKRDGWLGIDSKACTPITIPAGLTATAAYIATDVFNITIYEGDDCAGPSRLIPEETAGCFTFDEPGYRSFKVDKVRDW
jgi:hypothetical protein